MSAITKDKSSALKTSAPRAIRAGAAHVPIAYSAIKSHPQSKPGTVDGLNIPQDPEQFIGAETYLECLSRIEHRNAHTHTVLQAGLCEDLGLLGLVGKSLVHAANLWSALQFAREGLEYFQPGSHLQIRIKRERCRITYRHGFGEGEGTALDTQYTMGLLGNLLKECSGMDAADLSVGYPRARADHWSGLDASVQVLESGHGIIEFNDRLLGQPLRRSNARLADIARLAMDAENSAQSTGDTIAARIEGLQTASLERQSKSLSQSETSGMLGVSVRMMQYYLQKEGHRFDTIRDASRHKLAKRLLLEGRSIEHVSERVGFAHRQGFSTAFTKWEGTSPAVFRSQNRVVKT